MLEQIKQTAEWLKARMTSAPQAALVLGSGLGKLGEEIEVDMEKGLIISESGKEIEFKKLPPFMLEILESGGLINYLKNQKDE